MGYHCNGKRVSVGGEYVGRAGCGYDLTDRIEAIPEDGEDYAYECPVCKNAGTVRRVPAGAPVLGRLIGE